MKRTFMSTLCLAGAIMLAWSMPSTAQDHAKKDDAKKGGEAKMEAAASTAKIGAKAPEFALKDTNGKEVKLADLTKEGKIVVLEWFNVNCPVCAKHAKEKTVINLVEKYQAKGVVFLGIDSTHNQDAAKTNQIIQDWGVNYPVLADADGKIGKGYGAKTTPHMFIINKDGTLVYEGAIDNEKESTDKAYENYVSAALDQILAGETVAKAQTKPYGCSVKYKG